MQALALTQGPALLVGGAHHQAALSPLLQSQPERSEVLRSGNGARSSWSSLVLRAEAQQGETTGRAGEKKLREENVRSLWKYLRVGKKTREGKQQTSVSTKYLLSSLGCVIRILAMLRVLSLAEKLSSCPSCERGGSKVAIPAAGNY